MIKCIPHQGLVNIGLCRSVKCAGNAQCSLVFLSSWPSSDESPDCWGL